jgi:uncharacterized protein (TIGR00730 family)
MNITVFGGAQCKPGDILYEDAKRLGSLLGKAGFVVLTGGYSGTMEAVSQGAEKAGAHVIGVTCVEIEDWRKVSANAWVKEGIRFSTLENRMRYLMDNCKAAIALPGGVGTLTEISFLWNRLLVGATSPKPLIIIGSEWEAIFNQVFEKLGKYIAEQDKKWLLYVKNVDEAVTLLSSTMLIETPSK